MRTTDSVTVTTVVAIDPATAFKVFTEETAIWWKPGPQSRFGGDLTGALRFEQGPGGRLLEVRDAPAGEPFEVGRVLIWEPPIRLAFEWRAHNFEPGERTEVEVRFEQVDNGTRVTVEHRGWDSLRADHPARFGYTGLAFGDIVGLWWADLLVSIKSRARSYNS
jgi:uncharacterized protein YndB with AHSA1/START domain